MSSGRSFTLGEWRVEPARGAIVAADGQETRIEPQLMQLLLLFAGAPGEVISKDRIIASVWSGRAIGDDTLAAAISRLRAALGPKRYIETLPKRGYRLVARPAGGVSSAARATGDVGVAQGYAILKSQSALALPEARLYFEAAIRDDPANAEAHAGLAQSYLLQHFMGSEPSRTLVHAAEAAAHAALAHEAGNPLANSVLGCCVLLLRRDFAAADAHLQKALASDPDSIIAHRYRGLALAAAGRFVEAEREVRAAIACDPLSLPPRAELLRYLFLARRYVTVIAEAKRTLAIAPDSRDALSAMGWAHHLLGEDAEALNAFLSALGAWGLDPTTRSTLAEAYRLEGFAAVCSATADIFEQHRMGFIPRPTDIAILRASAGEDEKAFSALSRAAGSDDPYLMWVIQMPQLDRLRNDGRFVSLAERLRLVNA